MKKELGNTKLIEYTLSDTYGNRVFVKDESTNPSGSIKDRTAYQMLLDYKNSGVLKDGATIIEATSGNTGISLAYFQKEFNYNAIIVMPVTASIERRNIIQSYGAKLELVDGGMKECSDKVNELLKKIPNSFVFDQFNNLSNPKAHLQTAKEIEEKLPSVDYIFAGIGTGGTATGLGMYFKDSKTKVIGVEPEESPLLTKGFAAPHQIQGIGANFVPSILRKDLLSSIVRISSKTSINAAKTLRNSGLFDVGISSGAALSAALNYIKENKLSGKTIVVIFPDKGDRYSW